MVSTEEPKVQPKKLFDPANPEELSRVHSLHSQKGQDRHNLVAKQNEVHHYWPVLEPKIELDPHNDPILAMRCTSGLFGGR